MASKEMITIASTPRIRAKKPWVGRQRLLWVSSGSASCQPARITNGMSRAVSAISATAMPSTPSSYRTPKSLIQACDSVSW